MYVIQKENMIYNNTTAEIIRLIDVQNEEYKYIESQLGSNAQFVDLKARNCLPEDASAVKLKCISKFNQYGKRNAIINKGLVKSECLRYTESKDQYYIIKYKAILNMKSDFIIDLYNKLQKENTDRSYQDKIL